MADDDFSESYVSDHASEDVANTLAIISHLKSENSELRRNFDNLKGLHLQLAENHKGLQNRYAALQDDRNNVEKQYQSLCESWRVELEEKQRQLDAAKAQLLGPKDLELLKVKLLEEVEAPFRTKCDNLAKEAASSQEHYLRLRRQHEELQNAYRSLEVRTLSETEVQKLEHAAMVRDLKDKVAQLTATHGKLAKAEATVRSLQRDLESARFSASQMKHELDEVRRHKERAVVDREGAASSADRKVREAQEEVAQLMSFVESVSRKNRHLVTELAESQRAAEDLFQANLRLQGVQQQLQTQLESSTRLASSEKDALAQEHEQALQRLEEKLSSLQADMARKDSAAVEARLAAQEELSKVISGWEHRLAEAQRTSSERQRQLAEERADMVEKLAAQQRAADERIRDLDGQVRQLHVEAEGAARDLAAAQQRVEGLEHQLAEAQASGEALRSELGDLKSDLVKAQMTGQQAAERKAELEVRLASVEESLRQAHDAHDVTKAELLAARQAADEARASELRGNEASRTAWGMEKAALGKRYQAMLREAQARHEGEVRRAKRKAKAAQAALSALSDEMAALKFQQTEAAHAAHMSEVLMLSPSRTGMGGLSRTVPGLSPFARQGSMYDPSRPVTAPSYPGLQHAISHGIQGSGGLSHSPSAPVVIVAPGGGAGMAGGAGGGGAPGEQAQAGGEGGAVIDAALLSSIAALRHRQQEYMDAARLKP